MPSLNTHIAHRCNQNAADQRRGMLILKLLCICIPTIFLVGITLDWLGIYKPTPSHHSISISKAKIMKPDDVDKLYARIDQENYEYAAMVDKLDLQHPVDWADVVAQKELLE